MKRHLLLLGLIGLYAGQWSACHNATANPPKIFGSFDHIPQEWAVTAPQVQTLKIPPSVDDPLPLSTIADSSWTVKLETTPESMLGRINKIAVHHNIIYVLDALKAKQLLAFDLKGQFLFKVGKRGSGPGAYTLPDDFCINRHQKEILVYDDEEQQVLYYDLQGQFLREAPLDFLLFGVASLEEKGYLLHTFGRSNPLASGSSYRLVSLDHQGQITYKGLPYDKSIEQLAVRTSRRELSNYGTAALYSPNLLGEIYHIQGEELQLTYRFDFGDKALPPHFQQLSTDDFLKMLSPENQRNNTLFIGPFFETDPGLLFYLHNGDFSYVSWYDKKSQRIQSGRLKDDLANSFHPHELLATYDGRYLIGSTDSYFLAKEKANFIADKSAACRQLLEDINPTDNPVLSFYRLR